MNKNISEMDSMFQNTNDSLELRMYFFTIYQLSGIQAGIQAGHSAIEYAKKFGNDEEFKDFAHNWKTWIVLNGGTTNGRRDFNGKSVGSLNQIADTLLDNDIKFAYFIEPDLNDTLTSVCFIADERVFNIEKYPDFIQYLSDLGYPIDMNQTHDELKETYFELYKKWVILIGGVKNEILRELIRNKKLA